MKYSMIDKEPEISAEGVVYVGELIWAIVDAYQYRESERKRYNLTALLMIVLLATLSVADSPTAIVEWGYHHPDELEIVLRIKPKRMPNETPAGDSWHIKSMKRK